jgi:hypothetical protein
MATFGTVTITKSSQANPATLIPSTKLLVWAAVPTRNSKTEPISKI